ncbi:hypothetical protein Tco_1136681 [Tanacetum coccineum]
MELAATVWQGFRWVQERWYTIYLLWKCVDSRTVYRIKKIGFFPLAARVEFFLEAETVLFPSAGVEIQVQHQCELLEMSSENGVNPSAPNPSTNINFSLLSVLGKERLTSLNYMDWMRNLRFTLRYENKEYVLDEQIPTINDDSTQEEIEAHQKHYDDANKVSCIMASFMSPKLQNTFENT